jgi:endonuclease/exonuclease/phosphatase family metal-dependent hydrolase
LTTWYGHLRRLDVRPGLAVTAGQRLGEVGDLGNATGCHLHFEVHPHGGSIYQDNIDPSSWLHSHVGHTLGGQPPRVQTVAQATARRGAGFTVATFNTLGASHTTATGEHPGMASGRVRTRGLVRLLERHHVDVAGLQEFQAPQHRAFIRLAGARYAVFHPPGDTENSIVWRRHRWRLVDGGWFPIPYFDGHRRRLPVVRLADWHRGTRRMVVTVVTVHNPADTSRYPRQQRWRARALAIEARMVRAMTRRGENVIVTGDFNDRRAPLCKLAAQARLHTADGGRRTAAGCRPGRRAGIDWILASPTLALSGHRVDRSSLVRASSDHPLLTDHVN